MAVRSWQSCSIISLACVYLLLFPLRRAVGPRSRGGSNPSLWSSFAGSLRPYSQEQAKLQKTVVDAALLVVPVLVMVPIVAVPGIAWEPVLVTGLVVPFASILIGTSWEQLALVGRGLTVKDAAKKQAAARQFSARQIFEFFVTSSEVSMVAPRLELGSVILEAPRDSRGPVSSQSSLSGKEDDDDVGPEDVCGRFLWNFGKDAEKHRRVSLPHKLSCPRRARGEPDKRENPTDRIESALIPELEENAIAGIISSRHFVVEGHVGL